MGSGKSLAGERLLQDAITRARKSINEPIPVYVDAVNLSGSLMDDVKEKVQILGDPGTQGVFLLLDGIEAIGPGQGNRAEREADVLVSTWPNSTVVLTSRPVYWLRRRENTLSIPPLSVDASQELIQLAAGTSAPRLDNWADTIQDAVLRPLFALLLGTYLKERGGFPSNRADLVSNLVNRALSPDGREFQDAEDLLEKLGQMSIDHGDPVPSSDIAVRARELNMLLDSTLVVEQGGTLTFPLPLFKYWFASRSLAQGQPLISDLIMDQQRLLRWMEPMTLAVGTLPRLVTSALLAPLVESQPAYASMVVNKAITHWDPQQNDAQLPLELQLGKILRECVGSWQQGVGPLSQLIGPKDSDGKLPTLGIQTRSNYVTTSWYHGDENLPEVAILPSDVHVSAWDMNWPLVKTVTVSPDSAWAWSWAKKELDDDLVRIIKRRGFPPPEGPLLREAVWQFALSVTGANPLITTSVKIREIRDHMSWYSHEMDRVIIGRVSYEKPQLDRILVEINRLAEQGVEVIADPWPGPDRDVQSGWVWRAYSPERLLERIREVYAAGMETYLQLVNRWFPTFSDWLAKAVILPARLDGFLHFDPDTVDRAGAPWMAWRLECLPSGSDCEVNLKAHDGTGVSDDFYEHVERNRRLRPQASEWLPIGDVMDGMQDIFNLMPATQLAYRWLSDDLRSIGWCENYLG